LLASTAILIAVTFTIPYLPFDTVFGFVPLPAPLLAAIAVITLSYVGAAELLKRYFYRFRKSAATAVPGLV
jgi:Mg2+-importing ATPase